MDRLAAAVETIAVEVRMIREIVDQLADDFAWALNNNCFRPERTVLPVTTLTSMPVDPLAPDFGERINKFSAADLLPDTNVASKPTVKVEQRQLWE